MQLRTARLHALARDPLAFGSTYEREAAFPESEWERLHHQEMPPRGGDALHHVVSFDAAALWSSCVPIVTNIATERLRSPALAPAPSVVIVASSANLASHSAQHVCSCSRSCFCASLNVDQTSEPIDNDPDTNGLRYAAHTMKSRAAVVGLTVTFACVGDSSTPNDGGVDGTADAQLDAIAEAVSDAPTDAGVACNLSKPFDAPIAVSELNSIADDSVLQLTHDELTAYFVRAGADGGNYDTADIFTASRQATSQPFGSIGALSAINSSLGDFEPSPAGDLTLFFSSDRAGTQGGGDLWVATRADALSPFGAVTALTTLNTTSNEGYAYALDDGLALYFRSSRNGTDDIFRATRTSSTPFSVDAATIFQSVNTVSNEEAPVVSPDELTLYFASDRTDLGAKGGLDVMTATRTSTTQAFGNVTNVGELNTQENELPSWISADGCRLYMTRRANFGSGDIFVASKPAN